MPDPKIPRDRAVPADERDGEPGRERSATRAGDRARRIIGRAVWAAYEGAGWAAQPLAIPHLRRRVRRGKEDADRFYEKLGHPSASAPADRPVWIHAASVGESVAGLALAERIAGPVLVTTATHAGALRVAQIAPAHVVHQFAPLDSIAFVRRFLLHWRPRVALFVEGEIWPATVLALARRGVPLALVNARLSDRTYARWQGQRMLALPLFRSVPRVLAQSPEAAARFASLGAQDVRVTGQLKFDAPPPVADTGALAALKAATGGRPVFLAASTHPGEEAAVVAAHEAISGEVPGLLTIIAPRHPERGDEVAALAGGAPQRSKGALPGSSDGLYVADTLGEMGAFFALADVVFLGASLVPLGGHNPAEPASAGAALVTGPDHGAMFAPFLAAGAAEVASGDALAGTVAPLLRDHDLRQRRAAAAHAVLARERGAVARTLEALADWVPTA